MSSEAEPEFERLPQDPMGFFGLDADFDPKELRRRYTRLIRRYKPERDPEAFQKIRSAYETLKVWKEEEDRRGVTPDSLVFPAGSSSSAGDSKVAYSDPAETPGGISESRPEARRRMLEEGGPEKLLEALRDRRAQDPEDLLLRGALRAYLGEGPEAMVAEWLEAPRPGGWSRVDFGFFLRAAESLPPERIAPWIDRIHGELPGEVAVFAARALWLRLGESGAAHEAQALHDRWLTREAEIGQLARAEVSLEVVRSILWTADVEWLGARLGRLQELEVLFDGEDWGAFGGAHRFWLRRELCESLLAYRRGWPGAEVQGSLEGSLDGTLRDPRRPLTPLRERLRRQVLGVTRNPESRQGRDVGLEDLLLRMRLDPETILEEWEPADSELRDLQRPLVLASVEMADGLGLDLSLEEQRLVEGSTVERSFTRFVAELTQAARGRLELLVLPRTNLGVFVLVSVGIMVLGGYLGRTLGAQLDATWGRAVVSLGVILGLGGWVCWRFLGDRSPYRRLERVWSARLYRELWRPQLIDFMMRSPLPPRTLAVEFENRGLAAVQQGGADRFAVVGERLAAQVRADPALELLWIAQCFGGCKISLGEEDLGWLEGGEYFDGYSEAPPLLGESDERMP